MFVSYRAAFLSGGRMALMKKLRTQLGDRRTWLRSALVAVVGAVCTVSVDAQSSAHQTWLRMLSRDDANRNGRIEASEYGGSARSFARFDADGDGALSEDELGVRLSTPTLTSRTARTTTNRLAARAEQRQTDEMDKLKLRQAALLFFQLDADDRDTRTLERDEFRRAFWRHDLDGNAELALRELVDGPEDVERRATPAVVENFAELLHRAMDTDESTRVDEIEALDWFDRCCTGVNGDAVSIATLERDRSAIARGAYDEISTERILVPTLDDTPRVDPLDPAPIRREALAAAADDATPAPEAAVARERVALAKDQPRGETVERPAAGATRPAPTADAGTPVTQREAAPERAPLPDVGRRAPTVSAGTSAPAVDPARTAGVATRSRGQTEATDPAPARGTDRTPRDVAATTDEVREATPAAEPAREAAPTAREPAPEPRAKAAVTTRTGAEREPARGTSTRTTPTKERSSKSKKGSDKAKRDERAKKADEPRDDGDEKTSAKTSRRSKKS